MRHPCGHRLCGLVGGSCSLVGGLSHGCHSELRPRSTVEPEIYDHIHALLTAIPDDATAELEPGPARDAAVRLAAIVRREAREGRSVVAQARDDAPALVAGLERLCTRARAEDL